MLGKIAELSVQAINRCSGTTLSERDYLRGRALCERALRRQNALFSGLDAEVNLHAIVGRLLRQFRVYQESLLDELVSTELQLEVEGISTIPGANLALSQLKERKKKVFVLSDMYLTSDALREFASRLGLADHIDAFYVSGEVGLSKSSGRLFEHVLRQHNIVADQFLHIGDNYRSDFLGPSRLGIPAKWFYQPTERKRRFRTAKRLAADPLRFAERLLENRSKATYGPHESLECQLFSGFAPAVFLMAYRSLSTCVSLGIERLYFLARDGIPLQSVFECLRDRHPEFQGRTFDFRTLYCSRSSTVCARLPDADDDGPLAATVAERSREFGFDSFLEAWNVDKSQLRNIPKEQPVIRTREELFQFLFAHPKLRREIRARISGDRKRLIAYLKQEGITEQPCAFVDVGWSGTIQRNVEALKLDATIHGMYLGTNDKFETRTFSGFIFSPSDYRAGAIHKSAPLTEMLLSVSGIGTTVGYDYNNGAIHPVFKNGGHSTGLLGQVRTRVFDDFYPLFEELTRKYCIPTNVLLELARRKYFGLVCRPTGGFLRDLRDVKFSFDWGRDETHNLVKAIAVADLIHPRETLRSLWNSPWIFGSMKASHLGILNLPLSWVMGHEDRVNLKNFRVFQRILDK